MAPVRRMTAGNGIKVHNSATIKDALPSLASMNSKTGLAPVTIGMNPFPRLKGFNAPMGAMSYQRPLTGDMIR